MYREMESLFTTFLIFLAAITALLTYLIIPRVPVVTLAMAASVALAGGVWWHWTQFAVDYRTSTWQEQLRSYASWAFLLVIILLSYAFYVFGWSTGKVQEYVREPEAATRNIARTASSFMNSASRAVNAATNTVRGAGVAAMNRANVGLTNLSLNSTETLKSANFLA
jgi:hypothetical protein